jgi:hypothetical protein
MNITDKRDIEGAIKNTDIPMGPNIVIKDIIVRMAVRTTDFVI